MIFHWSLNESKSRRVSKTLRILADLNNPVVWRFAVRPPISNSSNLWGSFLVHQLQLVSLSHSRSIAFLVLWQGLSTCLSFRFLWFKRCSPSGWQSRPFGRFTFLLTIIWSCLLARIRLSKSQRILCVSFTWTDSVLSIYHLVVWSHLNFLHKSPWIICPPRRV